MGMLMAYIRQATAPLRQFKVALRQFKDLIFSKVFRITGVGRGVTDDVRKLSSGAAGLGKKLTPRPRVPPR
jgi:hypothetical protein